MIHLANQYVQNNPFRLKLAREGGNPKAKVPKLPLPTPEPIFEEEEGDDVLWECEKCNRDFTDVEELDSHDCEEKPQKRTPRKRKAKNNKED